MAKIVLEDLIGKKFNRLTIISAWRTGAPQYEIKVLCKCECGNETEQGGWAVRTGRILSCGCFAKENVRFKKGHPETKSPEYYVWNSMRMRCHNPNTRSYATYGAKGITVCDRWRNSFENFWNDMGRRPSDKHSIERLENDKGYGPDNCKWATTEEQVRNKSTTMMIEFNGEKLTQAEWARKMNMNASLLCRRLKEGWDIGLALNTPSARGKKHLKNI